MSAEFIMSLAKEIDRLRDVLAKIRLLTHNPDDNGLAVLTAYYAATMGLCDDGVDPYKLGKEWCPECKHDDGAHAATCRHSFTNGDEQSR